VRGVAAARGAGAGGGEAGQAGGGARALPVTRKYLCKKISLFNLRSTSHKKYLS